MSKKLLEKIDQLEKRIVELEGNKAKAVELPFWMPKEDEFYRFISFDGDIDRNCYFPENSEGDRGRIAIGNYFETETLAQKHLDKLKLLEEIKQWRGKHDPKSFKLDWEDYDVAKWELIFNHDLQEWGWNKTFKIHTPQAIYLSAPLNEFIIHFGTRLDLLLEGLK